MKKIGVLVCLCVMAVSLLAPASFAAGGDNASSEAANFTIESSTPENNDTGVAVENLSVKLYFSTDMKPQSDAVEKANKKAFKITDPKGKKVPTDVYYSDDEEGLVMVVSDTMDSDITIKGDTKYTLTIDKSLQAANGQELGETSRISFRTLDQSTSNTVYMIMMVVMIVGMIFFTMRSTKKAAEKENQEKGKHDTVNPYKEAKRTGKSVEEIVAKDRQKKAKEAEALAKKRAREAEIEAELFAEEEEEESSGNKRVSGPRPISAAGSDYKVKVVKTNKPQNKGTTNPKGQTGKQRNSKNSKNKKKRK